MLARRAAGLFGAAAAAVSAASTAPDPTASVSPVSVAEPSGAPGASDAAGPGGAGFIGSAAGMAADVASAMESLTFSAAGSAAHAVASASHALGRLPELSRQLPAARRRALRARNRIPLPSLYALYPEASRLPVRSLGIRDVPVEEIAGTAVAGPDQRGSDFLPLPAFRSSNWQGRWQRIRRAVERMETLPPVDLQRFDDRYWVVDGHNRVAAALYGGQAAVDATVVELVVPGAPRPSEPVSLAPELAAGQAIRTAAGGRPTSLSLASDLAGEASILEAMPDETAGHGDPTLGLAGPTIDAPADGPARDAGVDQEPAP